MRHEGPARLRAPARLNLTEKDEVEAFALLCDAIIELKPAPGNWRELAWALAAKVVRGRKRKKVGRKEKWPLERELLLVAEIDKELEKRGLKSGEEKALWAVVADLEKMPYWAPHTAKRLRVVYYEAKPKLDALKSLCPEFLGN